MYKVIFYADPENRPEKSRLDRFFEEKGIAGTEIVEERGNDRTCFFIFRESSREALRLLDQAVKELPGIDAEIMTVEDKIWKNAWKTSLKPFRLIDGITVVPGGRDRQDVFDPAKIYLDSDMTFGIGTHPTTVLMARCLAVKKNECSTFFDVGCGTGILSVLAERYGFIRIKAIDADTRAVATARRNIALNRCRKISLAQADISRLLSRGKRFDLVAVNMISEDLVRFRDRIVPFVKAGGYLAVSGISADNYPSFRRRFVMPSFDRCALFRRRGWVAVIYRVIAGKK